MGRVAIYLNCAAIIYLLIHSIFLRRSLVKLNLDLDKGQITASDFAILGRNLPKNITQEVFKQRFESRFKGKGVKIEYVNYTYKIDKFIEAT